MTTDVLIAIGVAVGLLMLLVLLAFVTLLLMVFVGLLWWLEQRRQQMETSGDAAAGRSPQPLAVRAWRLRWQPFWRR